MKTYTIDSLYYYLDRMNDMTSSSFYGYGVVSGQVEDSEYDCDSMCENDICRCYRINRVSVCVSSMEKIVDFFITKICQLEILQHKDITAASAIEEEMKKLLSKYDKDTKNSLAHLVEIYRLNKEDSYSVSIDSDPYGDCMGEVQVLHPKDYTEFNLHLSRLTYMTDTAQINDYLKSWIDFKEPKAEIDKLKGYKEIDAQRQKTSIKNLYR